MESGTLNIEELHAKSTIRTIKLADLKVDRSYQRDPSQSLVDKIASEWDEVASELLLVSDRGEGREELWVEKGRFYIVNGQHRSLAAAKKSIKQLSARVIDLSEHPDPAAVESLFRLRTNVRMGDKPAERFKAQVRAGDPKSLAIVQILARFDTEINENPTTDAGINAVASVEKLYDVEEGKLLVETLQLLKDIYGVVGGKSSSAPTMVGLAWFILKHAGESNRTRLVEQLKGVGHAALDRRARTIGSTMGGTLWMNYYRAVVDFYNDRLADKSRLEWRTRGATSFKGAAGKWGRSANE